MSSWQPNPNAKPFTPASAYFSISVPCMKAPIRLRKKGIFSRVIQWILVIVLCVTVVINLIFIWDTTRRYNKDSHVVNSDKTKVKINGLGRNENGGNTILLKLSDCRVNAISRGGVNEVGSTYYNRLILKH